MARVSERYKVYFTFDGESAAFVRAFSATSPEHAQSKALRWFKGKRPGVNVGASEGELE